MPLASYAYKEMITGQLGKRLSSALVILCLALWSRAAEAAHNALYSAAMESISTDRPTKPLALESLALVGWVGGLAALHGRPRSRS